MAGLSPAWVLGPSFFLSDSFEARFSLISQYTSKKYDCNALKCHLKRLYTAEMGILVVWLRMIRFASIKNPVQNAKPKK